jgi:hypothetical protein
MIVTVADMSRLEQAARVSMSGFHDIDASVSSASHVFHPWLRIAIVAAVVFIVLAGAFQLA